MNPYYILFGCAICLIIIGTILVLSASVLSSRVDHMTDDDGESV